MKKLFAGLLCSALLMTAAPALAATAYTVEVEGEVLALGTTAPYEESGHVMLPLRAVAEALGFTITWDQGTKTATLDDGAVKSSVTIGKDSYSLTGSENAGAGSAQSFGAVPALREGTTFVPSELFTLLCGQTTVKDGKVSIRMEASAQLPNPMVEYPDPAAASEAVGFAAAAPTLLPEGYTRDSIWVTGGSLLEIRYRNGDGEIHFRMAKGTGDVSGDYTEYGSTVRQPAGHTEFTLKGNGDMVALVLWTEGDYAYSLLFTSGVSADGAVSVAESVKTAK